MSLEETGQLMDILETSYPQFYKNQTDEERAPAVTLWASMFADDPAKVVAAAVKALIVADVKGYPPHIGAVKARIRQLTEPEGMTETEAWGLISKALSNGIYGAKDEFEKLPPVLQKLVGTPNQLKEWALMDSDSVQSVVASNLMRSYRVLEQRERDYMALPRDVKRMLGTITKPMIEEAK